MEKGGRGTRQAEKAVKEEIGKVGMERMKKWIRRK